MNSLFNSDSEVAVLNIIMNHPDKYYELTGLKHYMFSSSPNETIFKSIQLIVHSGLTPEYSLLLERAKEIRSLDAAGGLEYLNYIKGLIYDPANLKEFERLVIDSYKARILVETSSKLASSLHAGEKVTSIIQNIKDTMDKLGDVYVGEDTEPLDVAVAKAVEVINSRVGSDQLPGIPTGYSNIDTNTGGVFPGDVWVIGGRPGQGKSAFICNMALHSASVGNPVLVFSMEMPKQTLIERFVAIKSGIPISNIRLGLLSKEELVKINVAADEISKFPIYIDTNYFSDMDYIIGTIKKYKKQKNIQLVFLDYVQLLAERSENMVHEIGRICRGFKLLSNSLNIGSVLLSQLNRAVELRDDKRPVLSDFRQSGDLEQDADLGAFVYRPVYYDPDTKQKDSFEFIIRKQRNGPLGTIYLKFDPETNKIWEK